MNFEISHIAGVILFVLAISIKPLRKIIGLLVVILGAVVCLTGIGVATLEFLR